MIDIEIIGLVAQSHLTKDVFLDFAGFHLVGLKSLEAIVPPQGKVSICWEEFGELLFTSKMEKLHKN